MKIRMTKYNKTLIYYIESDVESQQNLKIECYRI